MNQMLSVCGLLCNKCQHYDKLCQGCYAIKGSTFWANEMMSDKICPIFRCCIFNKGHSNCGQCAELPCSTFTDLKDPNVTDDEHQQSIRERITRLTKWIDRDWSEVFESWV